MSKSSAERTPTPSAFSTFSQIAETCYEGAPHFLIRTPLIAYYYDKSGESRVVFGIGPGYTNLNQVKYTFMNRLSGRVAIITGGARGIGKATAERFLKEGAEVVLWDVAAEAGAALVEKWSGEGHRCRFFEVDIRNLAAVLSAASTVVDAFGRIDILVNNAGITRDASMKKMTPEQWQEVIDVNLTGVFNCTKAVYPFMAEQGYGRILNAASVVALYGNFGQTNYVAAKSGLIGMTKVWAREFGPKGITVNAVAPGFIQTEMVKTIPDEIIEGIKGRIPVGRFGEPTDIANAYAFLASDEADFINGATLSVDGGMGTGL